MFARFIRSVSLTRKLKNIIKYNSGLKSIAEYPAYLANIENVHVGF